ncbi:MAG: excalibur calcium-binding domain-containing protein [Sphaerobacter sp.]|nr:excalibur calcium-binding domain-containing protein [Sphaerobacter sp.]
MTHRLGVVLLLIGLLLPAASAGAQQLDLLEVTCGDFPSQAAAQRAYRADPVGLKQLDRDGDGIACEDRPGPYDYTRPGGSPTPPPPPPPPAPAPEPPCTFYPETGHSLCGGFRQYWRTFGGLAVYGFPITDEFVDPTTGRMTQWLERARFEWHPGSWPERFDVQLGLLGNELATARRGEAPFQPAAPITGCTYFEATGHNLCGGFRTYWEQYGGLAVYGMPISEEFREVNPDTGVEYTVQYFERQRFEWHPGEWPERYDVMLGRLGAQLHATPSGAR